MDKQLKKAQVSMEFVFLIGLAFTVALVFTSSTRSEFDDLRSEEERNLVKDLSVSVQQEFIIASTVEDGYSRTFNIPSTLNNIEYSIQINSQYDLLVISTDDYESVLNMPPVEGTIQKGDNVIRKINGQIYLN